MARARLLRSLFSGVCCRPVELSVSSSFLKCHPQTKSKRALTFSSSTKRSYGSSSQPHSETLDKAPPPTPLARLPTTSSEWRFESITSPCEWVERYRPGGYHPVDLGDVLHDGQYRVLRKLGEGASSSTVWLARDDKNHRYVALKILVAKPGIAVKELHILRLLATGPDAGQYVTKLLDEFDIHGPNGTHKCLVLEAMGPSVTCMVKELPQFKPRNMAMRVRFPPAMAKSILKQALLGLRLLHEHGISQADFQPGNMLFGLEKGIDSKGESALCQQKQANEVLSSEEYGRVKVERKDGKPDRWAPQYLYVAQPLVEFTPYNAEDFKIKLSDMGNAFPFSYPPEKVGTPVALRPPELILANTAHKSLDIWSFGCLVFELVTGNKLFSVEVWDPRQMNNADDGHLCQLALKLGPLPDDLYRRWERSSLYFTPERKFYNYHLGGIPEGEGPVSEEELEPFCWTMERFFDELEPDVSAEEGTMIKTLVRRILQFDPEKRPSTAEILQDPWFAA